MTDNHFPMSLADSEIGPALSLHHAKITVRIPKDLPPDQIVAYFKRELEQRKAALSKRALAVMRGERID